MGALDRAEFEDMRLEVHLSILETAESVLVLKRPAATQAYDPQFQNPISNPEDNVLYELHYTQVVSSYLKTLGPERADFSTLPRFLVYLSSLEVERVLPDGVIRREQDIILLNGVEHEIDAVVPFPQLHGKSCVIKLRLTNRAPAEQDQGSNGA
ncbi:hypothetical protein KW797_01665 [Candidatus Parcubacteria bacterium]|nr:hypothetical protein [Candidatus Parcubacteria bacterium]